jgi:acyl carrier protein
MDTIEQGIRQYIVETFLFGQGGDELTREDSLLERGIVDSTGVLEIVAFLEEKWGVGVEDEELVPENFDSIARLSAFVQKKKLAAAE